jgi:hypothetical protein
MAAAAVAAVVLAGVVAARIAGREATRATPAPSVAPGPAAATPVLVRDPPAPIDLGVVRLEGSAAPAATTAPAPPRTRAPAAPATAATKAPPAGAAITLATLTEADAAFAAGDYATAAALYEEAAGLDPDSAAARNGLQRARHALAAPPRAALRTFVAGTPSSSRSAPAAPSGFEGGGAVAVRPVEAQAALPGKIFFDVAPPVVAPGEAFRVRAFFVNEGRAPLGIRDVSAVTTFDGRRAGGRLAPPASDLAPGTRALLLDVEERWRTETTSWALRVTVRTADDEVYANELVAR